MAQNTELSRVQLQAALAVAKDDESDEAIAQRLGLGRRTLTRWKNLPAFQAKVHEHREAWAAEIKRRGIAEKQNRIDAMVNRHRLLEQVIEERAQDPLMQNVAGGKTGLLVATPMLVKVYESRPVVDLEYVEDEEGGRFDRDVLNDRDYLDSVKRSVVEYEYALDTGLLKELRELEKQAAIELGQWDQKAAGSDGPNVEITITQVVVQPRLTARDDVPELDAPATSPPATDDPYIIDLDAGVVE
jgi:hypothetical protein